MPELTRLSPALVLLTLVHAAAPAQDTAELLALKRRIAEQERQIETMRAQLAEQKALLDRLIATAAAHPLEPARPIETAAAPSPESPTALRVGAVTLKPGGFLDLGFVARSKNLGSGVPTAFGSVPFGDTPQGSLSDVRFSAQNSRISLGAEGLFAGMNFKAYVETDFLGQAPPNIAVTSNGGSLRLRQFWVRTRAGKWEILGGQAWSLLTPNRNGIDPEPGAVFTTFNEDPNYMAGLVWGRDPQIRIAWRPNPRWSAALSLEAAEQHSAGQVTLPAALAPIYSQQINSGASNLSAPTVLPDFIAKLAYDGHLGRRSFHLEGAGLARAFRVFNPLNTQHYTTPGYGASLNGNVDLTRNLRLLANTFASRGGGRYIFGLGPDLVARPDGSISPVGASAALTGLEYTRLHDVSTGRATSFFGYWGGTYFDRQIVRDADGSLIGFGFPGSSSNANRIIQQYSLGVNQTIWRSPLYGALRVLSQYSYLTRSPWWMPAGRPSNAPVNMLHFGFRYELP